MIVFHEIEDPKVLLHLNEQLHTRLQQFPGIRETRKIGTPHGTAQLSVHFFPAPAFGEDGFWWAPKERDNGRVMVNLFGRGQPGESGQLNIDVQFNLAKGEFRRSTGGAFLRDIHSGAIVLAHRGIVTKGRARVMKATLYEELAGSIQQVQTSHGLVEYLLIGELESPSLLHDLQVFASELRLAVQRLDERTSESTAATPTSTTNGESPYSDYFDEFAGTRKVGARDEAIADCYHGHVVRALRDAFAPLHTIKKNRAIDLLVLPPKRAILFEVKTSADTQSIFTGVGQLCVHSHALHPHLKGRRVERVLVLPTPPGTEMTRILTNELEIQVLTYRRTTTGKIMLGDVAHLA